MSAFTTFVTCNPTGKPVSTRSSKATPSFTVPLLILMLQLLSFCSTVEFPSTMFTVLSTMVARIFCVWPFANGKILSTIGCESDISASVTALSFTTRLTVVSVVIVEFAMPSTNKFRLFSSLDTVTPNPVGNPEIFRSAKLIPSFTVAFKIFIFQLELFESTLIFPSAIPTVSSEGSTLI